MNTHYQTDSQGIYIGPATVWQDPEHDGQWLVPFGAVGTEPPALSDNQAARWTGTTWDVLPDFRGLVYWTAQRTRHQIVDVGIAPPDGYLTEDPGPTSEELAQMAIEQLKQQALALLSQSDVTVLRCVEAGVPVPTTWKAWRTHLRSIASTGTGPLQDPPDYPTGT
jgi:hypothetical protein